MTNTTKKIQTLAHHYGLWSADSKLILGVSGGPDSVCLLDIFSKLKKKYNLQLIIAHVNYGLRGKDSITDEEFVKKLAEKYELEAFVFHPEIKDTQNLESRLRDIRYEFFEQLRCDHGFDLIAVAHNLNDQSETFLMHLMRGAGLSGLSAMRFRSNRVIRPLLATTREEIIEYLKKAKLKYRTDRTNMTNVFLRNKVRNKLIPFLEKNFNPNIKKTLFISTLSIAEDQTFIQAAADAISLKTLRSVKGILNLSPALQKRAIHRLILEKQTTLQNIESAHIEEILKSLRSTKGKSQVVVFKGLRMTRKGDKLTIDLIKI